MQTAQPRPRVSNPAGLERGGELALLTSSLVVLTLSGQGAMA